MAFSPLENFRNFLSSRPPLVLFVVCIGMASIAFISYAYYIKYNDVYNPDANEKLNKFMENVTNLNLCTKLSNKSWTIMQLGRPRDVNLSQILLNDDVGEKDLSRYQTVSFLVSVSVSFLPKSDLFPRPITDFVSSFPASLLGISGKNENMTVAMEMVPQAPTNLKCADNKKVCLVEYQMCTTIMAPEDVIPCARKAQQASQCSFTRDNSTSAFIAWLDVSASNDEDDHAISECKSNILLKATKMREQLTIMLTLEKRSVVNMHLMHSSYFLFVVIITILLFGIITGGGERKHPRNQNNHYTMMNSGMS